jgi:DNA-directed RNA polymerase specialized sigma24 family protein
MWQAGLSLTEACLVVTGAATIHADVEAASRTVSVVLRVYAAKYRDHTDPDDLAQSAFLSIWQCGADVGSPFAYLAAVVRNQFLSTLRDESSDAAKTVPFVDLVAETNAPDDEQADLSEGWAVLTENMKDSQTNGWDVDLALNDLLALLPLGGPEDSASHWQNDLAWPDITAIRHATAEELASAQGHEPSAGARATKARAKVAQLLDKEHVSTVRDEAVSELAAIVIQIAASHNDGLLTRAADAGSADRLLSLVRRKAVDRGAYFTASFEELCLRRGRDGTGKPGDVEIGQDRLVSILLMRHADYTELPRVERLTYDSTNHATDRKRIQNRYANRHRYVLRRVCTNVDALLDSRGHPLPVLRGACMAAAELHFEQAVQRAKLEAWFARLESSDEGLDA